MWIPSFLCIYVKVNTFLLSEHELKHLLSCFFLATWKLDIECMPVVWTRSESKGASTHGFVVHAKFTVLKDFRSPKIRRRKTYKRTQREKLLQHHDTTGLWKRASDIPLHLRAYWSRNHIGTSRRRFYGPCFT